MDGVEQRLSNLLKDAVPEAPRAFDVDSLHTRHARRWLAPLAAALVIAAVAGTVLLVRAGRSANTGGLAGPSIQSSTSAPVADCPPTKAYSSGTIGNVDYLDSVYLYHRNYFSAASSGEHGPAVSRDRLGDQIGAVTCELTTLDDGGHRYITGPIREGNATALPLDTPLYAVPGFSPQCRIAAVAEGEVTEYLAQDDHAVRPLPCAVTPSPANGSS